MSKVVFNPLTLQGTGRMYAEQVGGQEGDKQVLPVEKNRAPYYQFSTIYRVSDSSKRTRCRDRPEGVSGGSWEDGPPLLREGLSQHKGLHPHAGPGFDTFVKTSVKRWVGVQGRPGGGPEDRGDGRWVTTALPTRAHQHDGSCR